MIEADHLVLLRAGLERLGEQAEQHPCEQYLKYIDLLVEWNQAYNLTSIKRRDDMIIHHLLDNLAAAGFLQGDYCLDVGSGAGLPGLILAMARPHLQWVLVDSNSKKIRFIRHVKMTLALENVSVVQERIEQFRTERPFSTVISRAFGPLCDYYQAVRGLVAGGGRIIAMKGPLHKDELQVLENAGVSYSTVKLEIPGLEKQRHLVLMDI